MLDNRILQNTRLFVSKDRSMMLRTLNAILLRRTCPAAACRQVGRNVCMQAAPVGGSGGGGRGASSSGERQRPSENRGSSAGPPGGRRRPSGAPISKDENSNGRSSSRGTSGPSLGAPSSPGMQRLAKVGISYNVPSKPLIFKLTMPINLLQAYHAFKMLPNLGCMPSGLLTQRPSVCCCNSKRKDMCESSIHLWVMCWASFGSYQHVPVQL